MERIGDFFEITNSKGEQLLFNPGVLKKASTEAERTFPSETGGILLGQIRTSDNSPILTKCSLAPQDSICERYAFRRGVVGIDALLAEEFENGFSYIGEWHSHPAGSPNPSGTDLFTMAKIRSKHQFPLKTPILLIVSGTPGNWRASFTHHHNRVGLFHKLGSLDILSTIKDFDC